MFHHTRLSDRATLMVHARDLDNQLLAVNGSLDEVGTILYQRKPNIRYRAVRSSPRAMTPSGGRYMKRSSVREILYTVIISPTSDPLHFLASPALPSGTCSQFLEDSSVAVCFKTTQYVAQGHALDRLSMVTMLCGPVDTWLAAQVQ